MTIPSEASSGGSSGNWLFKNKEHGKASAAASLVCLILLVADCSITISCSRIKWLIVNIFLNRG